MTYFRVNRLWRDEQERTYSEYRDFPTHREARAHANGIALKGGGIWMEQRDGRSLPILIDRKDVDAPPITREHLNQLRHQIRSLAAKKLLPKEDA